MTNASAITMQPTPATADLATVKARQQGAWASGDYSVVGTTLQIVGEMLCEALDLRSGQSVLDVAAGNGNVTLAAARRWCEVTSTDYVPALLDKARARAEADGLAVTFQPADAEALPFDSAMFDAVVSTFCVMFTPDQNLAASEMLRVCKPGGKIGIGQNRGTRFFRELDRVADMVAMTVGQQDMGDPLGHVLPVETGKARIVGQEGVDEDRGLGRVEAEGGVAEPGEFHDVSLRS